VPYNILFHPLWVLTCGPSSNILERAQKICIVKPLKSVRVVDLLTLLQRHFIMLAKDCASLLKKAILIWCELVKWLGWVTSLYCPRWIQIQKVVPVRFSGNVWLCLHVLNSGCKFCLLTDNHLLPLELLQYYL
jgi:hypothetical protein